MTQQTTFSYLSALQAAVAQAAQAGPHTAKLAATLGQALADFEAAGPEMTVALVNDMISGAAKANPLFAFLIPAEGLIDPVAKSMAGQLENWALGKMGITPPE